MAEFLTASRFYFEAMGLEQKVIKEVSGLEVESTPADEIHGSSKGGQATRQATPTVSKFTKVTLKLVATNNIDLYKWYEDCNKNLGGQSDWTNKRKDGSVTAYDQAGTMQARWEIKFCYPCKYTGPSFTASSSDMATETIELVHEGIQRVPV